MRSFSRILLLGTVVTLGATTSGMAAQNPGVTLTQENQAIADISPNYRYAATDAFRINDIESNDLDNAYIGAATLTTNSDVYWRLNSNTLYATASVAGAWKTFSGTVSASYSASGTITLNEATSDGAAVGSPVYHINLILTATGTPAALTQANLVSFLRTSLTKTWAASNTGTALVGTGLTTGWAVKAYGDNASTAMAMTIDPIDMVASLSVTTTASATPVTFTAALTGLDAWNVTTASTTTQPVLFTAANGRVIEFDVVPAQLTRAAGIGSTFLSSLTALPIKRLSLTNKNFLNPLPTSVSDLRAITQASPSGSLKAMYNTIASNSVAAAGTVIGDFTTKVGTTKWGLVALTPSGLASGAWSNSGSTVTFNAKVGSGVAKDFTCSLAGKTTIKTGTNEVVQFTAADGDAFWIKCFDATGLDATADTTIAVSQQPDLLAMQLVNTMSAQATIANASLSAIVTAGLS